MSILMITHDLGIVAEMADDVAVMYASKVVEYAPVAELFAHPLHPYTVGLFKSRPEPGKPKERDAERRSRAWCPARCDFRRAASSIPAVPLPGRVPAGRARSCARFALGIWPAAILPASWIFRNSQPRYPNVGGVSRRGSIRERQHSTRGSIRREAVADSARQSATGSPPTFVMRTDRRIKHAHEPTPAGRRTSEEIFPRPARHPGADRGPRQSGRRRLVPTSTKAKRSAWSASRAAAKPPPAAPCCG